MLHGKGVWAILPQLIIVSFANGAFSRHVFVVTCRLRIRRVGDDAVHGEVRTFRFGTM